MNKRTVALTNEQYTSIITAIKCGFCCAGREYKPNDRIATALTLEANLGLRISDILQLHYCDIVADGDRYRLNIHEIKTGKEPPQNSQLRFSAEFANKQEERLFRRFESGGLLYLVEELKNERLKRWEICMYVLEK